jgi:DNA ligase-1
VSVKKPMLAATCHDFAALKFPLYGSLKLDGVRALITKDGIFSRSLKLIPNMAVQRLFTGPDLDGLDGEFIFGDITAPDVCRRTVSQVMSPDKGADGLVYHVFDYVSEGPFSERYAIACQQVKTFADEYPIKIVRQVLLHSLNELEAMEEKALAEGHEGIMVRQGSSFYKHGRATERSQDLSKVKRFSDSEATIIGFEEKMTNGNAAFTNELGRTARSSHQENMVPAGTLGALLLRTPEGIEFGCGTGYDDALRAEIWKNRKRIIGKSVTYKHFEVGVKDAPRFPVFVSFREDL